MGYFNASELTVEKIQFESQVQKFLWIWIFPAEPCWYTGYEREQIMETEAEARKQLDYVVCYLSLMKKSICISFIPGEWLPVSDSMGI